MKIIVFLLLATSLSLSCGCGRSPDPKGTLTGEMLVVTPSNGGVHVSNQGRKVEITRTVHGIDIVTQTKDGTRVGNRYKDVEELERKDPELYGIYKQHEGSLDWRPHFKIVDKGGAAGLQFDHWVVVFEAVPANTVPIGLNTADELPIAMSAISRGGRGQSSANGQKPSQIYVHSMTGPGPFRVEASIGDLRVSGWGGNAVSVNGCDMTLTDSGSKLVFADRTYVGGEGQKTIVVSKDGKTREHEGR